MHSTLSDGNESPCGVVDTAARVGLKKICITDHDGIHKNYDKVREYAKTKGVEVLPFMGTEVNTLYYDGHKPLVSVHVLVFGDDEKLKDERFVSMINKYFAHTNALAIHQYEMPPRSVLIFPMTIFSSSTQMWLPFTSRRCTAQATL